MDKIKPFSGVVLVELAASEWGDIPVPSKPHDSLTSGKIVRVGDKGMEHLVGQTAYWRKYKDDARVGKNCAFIELKDILGTGETL